MTKCRYNGKITTYNNISTTYDSKTTAYNDKRTTYNDKSTVYNIINSTYNERSTTFNKKNTAYNKANWLKTFLTFHRFPTVESSSVRIHFEAKLFYSRKETMSRGQSERSKWSREQPQFFSHNYYNYSMFRDVPCSRFYRRPRLHTNWHLWKAIDKIKNMEHSGTTRNIPEHRNICKIKFSKIK